MCLAMNPDKLVGREICSFLQQPQLQECRQGSPHRPDSC